MLKRFNHWYDALSEPFRFIFFMVVLMGWLPFMRFEPFGGISLLIGSIWLVITTIIAISRIR